MCHYIHNWPHGYCSPLLRCSWYASYRNIFLFIYPTNISIRDKSWICTFEFSNVREHRNLKDGTGSKKSSEFSMTSSLSVTPASRYTYCRWCRTSLRCTRYSPGPGSRPYRLRTPDPWSEGDSGTLWSSSSAPTTLRYDRTLAHNPCSLRRKIWYLNWRQIQWIQRMCKSPKHEPCSISGSCLLPVPVLLCGNNKNNHLYNFFWSLNIRELNETFWEKLR